MSVVAKHLENVAPAKVGLASLGLLVRRCMRLGDGTTLSIQASEFHYALPRDNVGPYTHVEVQSNRPLASLRDRLDWTDEVYWTYAYVQVERVDAEILACGGFVDYMESR